MTDSCDIAIIGGGAAGLAAAIFAAEATRDARVVILDGAKRIGAKILVSGGGRCNVLPASAALVYMNVTSPLTLAARRRSSATCWRPLA